MPLFVKTREKQLHMHMQFSLFATEWEEEKCVCVGTKLIILVTHSQHCSPFTPKGGEKTTDRDCPTQSLPPSLFCQYFTAPGNALRDH